MTKVLVTGASGQLGQSIYALKDKFSELGFEFTDVDVLDICNADSVQAYIDKTKPDYLINCAAYTSVDKAETEKEEAFNLNSDAVGSLAEICLQNNVKLIHISTDYVFSGRMCRPYIEDDEAIPETVYGLSKLEGELRIMEFENTIILRTSWLYSQFGKNFYRTIRKFCSERDSVNVVSDQIGTPTYAYDLAEAILNIIILTTIDKNRFVSGIYHFSNEGSCSWYDFAYMINKITANTCEVIPVETINYPTPAPRPLYTVLNKNKIKNQFGFIIPNWINGLERCIAADLAQEQY
jgi:dTDP-4-dehydrorhamnose reductase